jgi:hypothetical protein
MILNLKINPCPPFPLAAIPPSLHNAELAGDFFHTSLLPLNSLSRKAKLFHNDLGYFSNHSKQ